WPRSASTTRTSRRPSCSLSTSATAGPRTRALPSSRRGCWARPTSGSTRAATTRSSPPATASPSRSRRWCSRSSSGSSSSARRRKSRRNSAPERGPRVEVESGSPKSPRFPAMFRILAMCLALLLPAAAFAQETPDALVKRVADEVLAVIKSDKDVQSGNLTKVVELAEQKVLPHFDFERMTRLAVGRNWSQANDAQKQALIKEFRTLLVRTYSTSLAAYRDQKIDVKPLRMNAQDNEVTVKTAVIQQGGPPI